MVIETGLSDYHKMTISILKTFFKKKMPVKINYRSYKNFIQDDFRNDLSIALQRCNQQTMGYENFNHIILEVLDSHALGNKR